MEALARWIKETGATQTMSEHSFNVARLCGDAAEKIGLKTLGFLIGIIHDMGKESIAFQNQLKNNDNSNVNHSTAGALYIYKTFYLPAKNETDRLTAFYIIMACSSQHSGLWNVIDENMKNGLTARMTPSSDIEYEYCVKNFFKNTMSENGLEKLFRSAADELGRLIKSKSLNSRFHFGMIQKYLFSALVDADRYDAYCCECGEPPETEQIPKWDEAANSLEQRLKCFKTDTKINKMRSRISRACLDYAKKGAGIYRLSVPTGAGKTLAALRYALNFAKENSCSHIFYVVPYTTILDQTTEEFCKICGEDMILEHHSSVVSDDKKYYLYTQRWNRPMILTTVVQFLNSMLADRSACLRRMNALANSVIIIDEVQAIPRKTLNLFNEAMNFLNKYCSTSILLCTATQPTLSKTSHAIQLSENCDIMRCDDEMKEIFHRTDVVDMSNEGMSYEEAGKFAEEQLGKNNSILMIVNTTAAAKHIYNALNVNCRKIYLTTKLCKAHRESLIKEIREKTEELSKKTEVDETEKIVVISTQLVEAGVDFSFSTVIRSLAGIDNLAQAAGRCNRNGEYKNPCKVFFIMLDEEGLSHLTEIKEAQEAAEWVIRRNRGRGLLDEDIIESYYEKLLKPAEGELDRLDYIIDKPQRTTIMSLLSDNQAYAKEFKHHYRENMIAKRMLERGGRRDIFLGTRECAAYVEPCGFTERQGYYDDKSLSFGIMVHGITYPDESGLDKLQVRLWNVCMKNGVIDFIRPDECTMVTDSSNYTAKEFVKGKNFSGLDEFVKEGMLDELDNTTGKNL